MTGDVSFLSFAIVVLRARRFIVGLGIVAALATVGIGLIRPRTFSATSAFVPQTGRAPGGLSSIAAQFNLSAVMSDPASSPAFYADLITSPAIIGAAVDTRYRWSDRRGERDTMLVHVFQIRGRDPELGRDRAIRMLRARIAADVTQRTGVVRLTVTLPSAGLAAQVNERLLDLLNEFNLVRRQSQAAAERRFAEKRVQEIKLDLTAAETAMKEFLQRNREYAGSPQLQFEFHRLERELDLQQQLYAAMARAYEQAKIEEVRDTPVVTITESPRYPVRPDPRRLLYKGLAALLGGIVLGLFLMLGKELVAGQSRISSSEATEFAALIADARRDLSTPPWRWFSRHASRTA